MTRKIMGATKSVFSDDSYKNWQLASSTLTRVERITSRIMVRGIGLFVGSVRRKQTLYDTAGYGTSDRIALYGYRSPAFNPVF